tara:strand:+ start:202 stop:822 length:621 start_codon:yes stop_codon:yes gene_type:complete
MSFNLPEKIAVFPLANVIFFPKTVLPLNIFEKRYIQLVEDCMKNNRTFGIVQPKLKSKVYDVGCLGKIISFSETNDKRFIIILSGVSRFRIREELVSNKLYREFKVDYKDFENDLKGEKFRKKYDMKNLIKKTKVFFEKKNYLIDWKELEKLDISQLITTLCMISPFSVQEKQKLIETIKLEDNYDLLEKIININILDNLENKTIQ